MASKISLVKSSRGFPGEREARHEQWREASHEQWREARHEQWRKANHEQLGKVRHEQVTSNLYLIKYCATFSESF